MSHGIRATLTNIGLSGGVTLGSFSKSYHEGDPENLLDDDLALLRRLINSYSCSTPPVKLLLIEGNGPDFSKDLAYLLSQQGIRSVIVPLNFERFSESNEKGLLKYLKGDSLQLPEIENIQGFSRVLVGGVSSAFQQN